VEDQLKHLENKVSTWAPEHRPLFQQPLGTTPGDDVDSPVDELKEKVKVRHRLGGQNSEVCKALDSQVEKCILDSILASTTKALNMNFSPCEIIKIY
jgi:hypothetical protein